MIVTQDIKERIESDFGDNAYTVFNIFDEAFEKADYLNVNRIIRCILFLADKNIEKLQNNIAAAIHDPRDIMLWAEYTNQGQGGKLKRIRDFNKTFKLADIDIKE